METPLTIDIMKSLKKKGYRELIAKGQFGSKNANFIPVKDSWDEVTEDHPEDFKQEDFIILLVNDNIKSLSNDDLKGMTIDLSKVDDENLATESE